RGSMRCAQRATPRPPALCKGRLRISRRSLRSSSAISSSSKRGAIPKGSWWAADPAPAGVGELCIGRAAVILKADKVPVDLLPIRHDPDEAGLIGGAHLSPRWMFEAHDAILAVDIGGTNIRAGVVTLNLKKASDLSKALVWKFQLLRHADEANVTPEEAAEKPIDM